jgi:uncharacterized protein (DUF1778 family)
MKAMKMKPILEKLPRDYLLQVRLTEDEKRLFAKAAEVNHMSLSTWVRLAGFKAAREGISHDRDDFEGR